MQAICKPCNEGDHQRCVADGRCGCNCPYAEGARRQHEITHEEHLATLLRDVVVAADRMRDNWAEADEAVRQKLWRDLHAASARAQDEVYPL